MNPMPETNKIDVSVKPQYLLEQSDPNDERFVFAYTVTISNNGQQAADLVSRHWVITDADGEEEHVRGAGVVGEFPHLHPGESYQYTSGSVLKTPVGSMAGSYQMKAEDGTEFKAPIAPFTLSSVALH